jgi:hypothetical protein
MASLRTTVGTLQRFPPGQTFNVREVARFVRGFDESIKLKALIRSIQSLPPSVTFREVITTDTALGGEVRITLSSDGNYRFSGSMRATGFPSFSFRVGMVVRSGSGQVMVAAQHDGKVFGTDTPGDREDRWDQPGGDLERMRRIREVWPDISRGTQSVHHTHELGGVLGVVSDLVTAAVELFVVAETLGVVPAMCFLVGSELDDVGAQLPGLGGVAGLVIVGGSVFIFGPGAFAPAIVLGVAVGAVIDLMVQLRPLSFDEKAFASKVFGTSLDFDRIRLTNLSGIGTRAFTMPALDGSILLNIGNAMSFPMGAVFPNYPKPGQILIHELTHAWQIQHSTFVPGWLCEGILTQSTQSKPYRYGPPGPPFGSFTIESQAAIVDQWFGGTGAQAGPTMMNENSPYFPYITDNIRLGQA